MMALALVPEEHVTSLFSNLCQELDESEHNELFGIFKYFNDDYCINRIPIWNCFKIPERERIIFAKVAKRKRLVSRYNQQTHIYRV